MTTTHRGPAHRGPARRPAPPVLRPLARRVHFLAGVTVAPFLVLACLTGLLYVISPQIHEGLYVNQLHASQGPAPIRPVDEQVTAALAAHPEARLASVLRPADPARTTWVNLTVPGTNPDTARTVFVDPYTNYIAGELTTAGGRMPANVWLREFHADLHLGTPGALYTAVATTWLPLILVAGLVLWFAKQGRKPRKARDLITPPVHRLRGAAGLRALHGGLGLWLTLGLLAVGITGGVMSRYTPALLDSADPVLVTAPVTVQGTPLGLNRALDVARRQGLTGNLEVRPPGAAGSYTVAERDQGLPARVAQLGVDPVSGAVTGRTGWDDYSPTAKLRWLGTQFHTGTLFGLANQIVLGVLVTGLLVLVLTGYRMWWRRNPYRGTGRLTPAPPAVLRQAGQRAAVIVAVAAALSVLLPVLGASLVVFLVADKVILTIAARRAAQRAAAAPESVSV